MKPSIYAGLKQRTFRQDLIHPLETDYGILAVVGSYNCWLKMCGPG